MERQRREHQREAEQIDQHDDLQTPNRILSGLCYVSSHYEL